MVYGIYTWSCLRTTPKKAQYQKNHHEAKQGRPLSSPPHSPRLREVELPRSRTPCLLHWDDLRPTAEGSGGLAVAQLPRQVRRFCLWLVDRLPRTTGSCSFFWMQIIYSYMSQLKSPPKKIKQLAHHLHQHQLGTAPPYEHHLALPPS